MNASIPNCDFWVIREGVPKPETTFCPKENIIFITEEPYHNWHYPLKFLAQFGLVIAFERGVKGENVVYGPPFESWSVGRKTLSGEFKNIMTYDELKAVQNFKKDKVISVCVSNKAFYPEQVKRLEFIRKLSKKMDIDVFGTNINDLDDKWDALRRYKYHIALENFICDDYFTCKLTDAFLGGCLPFYSGAPNILKYFPEYSLCPINIGNFNEAYDLINWVIDHDGYEDRIKDIQTARDLVLTEYNIFSVIARILSPLNPNLPKEMVTIHPAQEFQSLYRRAEYRLWSKFVLWKTRRVAEKAIFELSHGKTRGRKTR